MPELSLSMDSHSRREALRALQATGLLQRLGVSGLLLPFRVEEGLDRAAAEVPFPSHPWEWTFSALKEAAQVTLRLHREALDCGHALGEASAFQVQSLKGRMVHTHPLALERRDKRPAWVAYHQFCRHFLAPLALMAHRDPRLGKLLAGFSDGIPLDLARRLLPWGACLRPGLFFHLVLHDRFQPGTSPFAPRHPRHLEPARERALVDHLLATVEALSLPAPTRDEWFGYMDDCGYGGADFAAKEAFVGEVAEGVRPATLWDFGANVGHFSRLVAPMSGQVVALDADPWAAERNALECRKLRIPNVLPLVLDLTNPSPSLAWGGRERAALVERGPCDLGLALALVHHLALSAGIPFPEQARFFAQVCRELVVEFPERTDDRAGRMLAQRPDGAPWYDREPFEAAFFGPFEPLRVQELAPRHRRIYHLRRRS